MKTELIPSPGWKVELAGYDRWLVSAGLPASTRYKHGYHVRRFAVTSEVEPFDASLDDLVSFLSCTRWGPNMRRAVRSSLRSFYSWATVSGRIGRNPAEFLPPVAVPIGKPRPASEGAVSLALLASDARTGMMLRLGANVGLRCCEIALVSSTDLEETFHGWTLRIVGKGAKVRSVPVSGDLAVAILERGPGFIFPGQIGGHLSAAHVSKLLSRALPTGVTAHQLRHRFASRAYRAQHNLRAVQELLGHSSIATTQIYTAVDDLELRLAAEAAA